MKIRKLKLEMLKTFNISTLLLIVCASPLNGNAGINGTTVHSRANCVNNESITWWLGHSYNWRVVSIHNNIYGGSHHIDTGYQLTWRQAAVHWREAPLNDHRWTVSGHHFLLDYGNGRFPFDSTYVGDCSIYDGWWDY